MIFNTYKELAINSYYNNFIIGNRYRVSQYEREGNKYTMMNISKKGVDLIKSFEGCYLKAYKCPAGVWTIGWGTTEPINGVKPHSGMVITRQQADELLMKNLASYEKAVNNLKIDFNQNQFDALVSFCYNLGTGIFKGNLLEAIQSKQWKSVASQLLLYTRGGGVVLGGLVRRRAAEVKLFLTPPLPAVDEPLYEACRVLLKKKIGININQWKRVDLINLKYVPTLITKLGGLNKLIELKVISDPDLWKSKTYTTDNVRSLIIKYAQIIQK